ncbi:MAG TPA: hypothetical protein VF773_14530 [Verrucomicrobiae bacterium]
MEVKILCPCGAKYKFEVEPQNGRLPGPVSCPVCQVDGTELGNQVVAQALGAVYVPTPVPAQAAPAAPVSSSSGGRSGFVAPSVPRSSKEMRAAAAAPVVPVAAPPTPTAVRVAPAVVVPVGGSSHAVPSAKVVPSGAGPRLSVAGDAAPAVPMAVTAAHSSAPPVPPPPARPQKMEAEPSFMRGVMGIAAASFIALLVWFGITLTTGFIIKPLAIGVGAFIGWAGAWMAKQRSVRLGVIAAAATALAVIFGLMWSARHEAYQAVNETIDEMYKEQMEYAKAAVAASRNDTNLLNFIDENGTGVTMSDEDEDENFNRFVTASAEGNDVAANRKLLTDFKKNELPKLRKFADGKVSKSQFDRENRGELEAIYTIGFIVAETFRIKVILWIGLAIGAAWKLTSGQ